MAPFLSVFAALLVPTGVEPAGTNAPIACSRLSPAPLSLPDRLCGRSLMPPGKKAWPFLVYPLSPGYAQGVRPRD
jgi:hypothetical protein